jgi:hypothetical protein
MIVFSAHGLFGRPQLLRAGRTNHQRVKSSTLDLSQGMSRSIVPLANARERNLTCFANTAGAGIVLSRADARTRHGQRMAACVVRESMLTHGTDGERSTLVLITLTLVSIEAESLRSHALYFFIECINFFVEPSVFRFLRVAPAQFFERFLNRKFGDFSHRNRLT